MNRTLALILTIAIVLAVTTIWAKLPANEWKKAENGLEKTLPEITKMVLEKKQIEKDIFSAETLPLARRKERIYKLNNMMKQVNEKLDQAEKKACEFMKTIAKDGSPNAFKLLAKVAPVLVTGRLFDALVEAIDSMDADKLTKDISKTLNNTSPESNRFKIALMEMLLKLHDQKHVKVLADSLKAHMKVNDRKMPGIHNILIHLIDTLGKMAIDDNTGREVIDVCIRVVKRFDRNKGRIWMDAREVIKRLGGDEYSKGSEYAKWWKYARPEFKFQEKEKEDSTSQAIRTNTGSGGEYTTTAQKVPTLFGTEITSKLVVFVLDVSRSMLRRDPGDVEDDEENPDLGGTSVDEDPKTGVDEKDKKELDGIARKNKGIDPRRARIYRAKKELVKLIRDLPADTQFNIIAYSSHIRAWSSEGLKFADKDNKKTATQFVESFVADGTTWTDHALHKAFENKHADTIYLLSDGTPTHCGDPVVDSAGIIASIFEFVKKENRFRKIKINCLGFIGANRPFMQKLAKENNGIYKDIK